MTSSPASASIPLSLTLSITGVIERISAANGERDEGPQVWVDDLAVESLLYDTYTLLPPSPGTTVSFRRGPIITHDLLEGVDTSSEAVQRLLSNILALVNDEAIDALVEEAA